MQENSPWRYGFLLEYRCLLSLCPTLDSVIAKITAPTPPSADSSRLSIGSGLVHHGAMDVKHAAASAQSVASYFTNTLVATESLRGQGDGVNGYSPSAGIFLQFFRDGDRTAAETTANTLNVNGLDPIFPGS